MTPSTLLKNNRNHVAVSVPPVVTPITAVIGTKLLDLAQIAYVKRYRPLNEPLELLTPEVRAKMGVGVNSVDRQLAFEGIPNPEAQSQFLAELRAALAAAGLLERFFEMPDGTILRPELVVSGDYGSVANGCIVRLYGRAGDKPMMTCLCASEAECENSLQALSKRLNVV